MKPTLAAEDQRLQVGLILIVRAAKHGETFVL